MNKVLKRFIELTNIPHCSFKTQKIREYIIDFSNSRGYKIKTDSANNILAYKGSPKLCLQAHYDMVCVGDAPKIEPVIEGNILRAKNSSLGADNGIAIAMMMELIEDGVDAEFLFTNDEEVGLIGAKNLELSIKSEYLLNLDSEDEVEVYIGCAGGADIVAKSKDELVDGEGEYYEVLVSGLPGGHSGVDINKDIPNAIKELVKFLKSTNITQIVSIKGGERRNSIAANAVAVVRSKSKLEGSSIVEVKEIESNKRVLRSSKELLNLLDKFPHGVVEFNNKLNIPNISINLAQIDFSSDKLEFIATTRAMDEVGLSSINKDAINILESFGFSVDIEDEYPAWKPDINTFTKVVQKAMIDEFGKCELKAIHAGLECGVLSKKFPKTLFASIGPNIRFPHSKREYVELESIDRIYNVIKKILKFI